MLSLILLFSGLLGCSTGTKAECTDNGDCTEAGNACVAGKCKAVDCLSSADCEVYNFCNPNYECQSGCETDDDCTAGDTCNKKKHECSAYGCRSTDLDCEYGERCNATTGECEKNGDWCETCNANNLYSCGTDQYCFPYSTDGDGYCWHFCDSDSDCPRGFQCYELGGVYNNVCVGDCDYMTSNGYL